MRRQTSTFGVSVLLVGLILPSVAFAQPDPMLTGDPVDTGSGKIVELIPGLPWVLAGNGDDLVEFTTSGDVDIVVRSGITGFSGATIPGDAVQRMAVPVAVAQRDTGGVAIPFVVVVSDGVTPPATGSAAVSDAVEGNPVIVAAYADLDRDGFIGVTHLDGDVADFAIEEAELDPVGRRFAIVVGGKASGSLFVNLGGPSQSPVDLVLIAAAYTGEFDMQFFGGAVPNGPMVMTATPSFMRTDPEEVVEGTEPGPAEPDGRVGVQLEDEFTPDPTANYGEAFTLATEHGDPAMTGSNEITVDVARARSGPLVHASVARVANPATYDGDTGGPLRAGVDGTGSRVVLELLANPVPAGSVLLVPTDGYGNITDPTGAPSFLVTAHGGAQIAAPNTDQDTSREVLNLATAAGVALNVTGSGSLVVELVPEPRAALPFALVALASLGRWRRRRAKRDLEEGSGGAAFGDFHSPAHPRDDFSDRR